MGLGIRIEGCASVIGTQLDGTRQSLPDRFSPLCYGAVDF